MKEWGSHITAEQPSAEDEVVLEKEGVTARNTGKTGTETEKDVSGSQQRGAR